MPAVAVLNKSDLPSKLDKQYLHDNFKQIVEISAGTSQGVEALSEAITQLLSLTDLSGAGVWLQNERQRDCARRAAELLEEVCTTIEAGYTLDAVDVALDSALSALMELSGEKVSDTVIDQVFSKFCVGK